jgi:hypothetical protein
MEADFFEKVETVEVRTSGGPLQLPILYRDAFLAAGVFSAPTARVRELLPSLDLVPLEKWRGRSLVGFAAFSYRDTTIGPYNELGIVVPVKFRPASRSRIVPALRMASTLSFDLFVWKLPVTAEAALTAGVEVWGYPKSMAEITFEERPGQVVCRLAQEGEQVLALSVRRRNPSLKTYLEFNTYSVKDGRLLWTPVRGLSTGMARSFMPGAARLDLGGHPLSEQLRDLELSNRATLALYAPRLQAVLPAAEQAYPL